MFRNKIFLNNFTYPFNYLKSKSLASCGCFSNLPIGRLLSHRIFVCNNDEISGFNESFTLFNRFQKSWICKNDFSKMSDVKCWNCQQVSKLKNFTCSLCGALQYPNENVNYFRLFGVSQIYNIDLDVLSTKFKNLQMSFHPDKFLNKPKAELEISEIYSRVLNKAYTTLKDPLSRGLYLLELQKIPTNGSVKIEQEFLMSMMEKNEELEIITNKADLMKFTREIRTEIDKQILVISGAFNCGKLDEAKLNLLKLGYFFNLDEKIKGKEMTLNSLKNT